MITQKITIGDITLTQYGHDLTQVDVQIGDKIAKVSLADLGKAMGAMCTINEAELMRRLEVAQRATEV